MITHGTRLAYLIALAVCGACGGGLMPGEITPGHWVNFDGGSDERRVMGHLPQVLSFSDWTNTPWYRPSDTPGVTPVYVLLADGGYACVTDATRWTLIPEGALLACRWRTPRS